MTYEYEYVDGPNHQGRFSSNVRVSAIRMEGGQYKVGAQAHVKDMATDGPHVDKNVIWLDWEPEAS